MSREELIKAIDENEDAWSCPEYACDMPEKEGNTGECCLRCAEKQLKAYEDKIRIEAIDEIYKKIEFEEKWLFACYKENGCKYSSKDVDIAFGGIKHHLNKLRSRTNEM